MHLGLMFFSLADHGDLLIVQLNRGQVEVLFAFANGQQNARQTISGGVALNDGVFFPITKFIME